MRTRTVLGLLALAGVLFLLASVGNGDDNGGGTTPTATTASGTSAVSGDAQIAVTLALIDSEGPFPNRADGEVFENREGLLPDQPRGYYHAYTVETPGSPDRGARRIITGEGGELFYTDDHYESFRPIDREDYP